MGPPGQVGGLVLTALLLICCQLPGAVSQNLWPTTPWNQCAAWAYGSPGVRSFAPAAVGVYPNSIVSPASSWGSNTPINAARGFTPRSSILRSDPSTWTSAPGSASAYSAPYWGSYPVGGTDRRTSQNQIAAIPRLWDPTLENGQPWSYPYTNDGRLPSPWSPEGRNVPLSSASAYNHRQNPAANNYFARPGTGVVNNVARIPTEHRRNTPAPSYTAQNIPPWIVDPSIPRPLGNVVLPDRTQIAVRKFYLIMEHYLKKEWKNITLSNGQHIEVETYESFERQVQESVSTDVLVQLAPQVTVPAKTYCDVIKNMRNPLTVLQTPEGSRYPLVEIPRRPEYAPWRHVLFPPGYDPNSVPAISEKPVPKELTKGIDSPTKKCDHAEETSDDKSPVVHVHLHTTKGEGKDSSCGKEKPEDKVVEAPASKTVGVPTTAVPSKKDASPAAPRSHGAGPVQAPGPVMYGPPAAHHPALGANPFFY